MPNPYISQDQKEVMLEFMKARPQLYCGKLSPDFTRSQARALWEELATILYSRPNGASKEWSAWRKTWIDIKKNSKAKVAKQKKHQNGTGGGPQDQIAISSFETQVVELTSPVCVTGNIEVPEPIIIDFNEEEAQGSSLPSTTVKELEQDMIQNVQLDHAYTSVAENILEPAKDINQSQGIMCKKSKQRTTKTTRLNESIKNHKKLISISESAVMETKAYRAEKVNILKEQRDEMRKQTHLMTLISQSLCTIAGAMEDTK